MRPAGRARVPNGTVVRTNRCTSERRPTMTMAACGSVTAETLGFEASQAIPAAKGTLPKGLFAAICEHNDAHSSSIVAPLTSRNISPAGSHALWNTRNVGVCPARPGIARRTANWHSSRVVPSCSAVRTTAKRMPDARWSSPRCSNALFRTRSACARTGRASAGSRLRATPMGTLRFR